MNSNFFLKKKYSKISITTVLAVVMLFLVYSCGNETTDIAQSSLKREKIPVLKAKEVITLISDSGITRFRIATTQWLIYDKTDEPYWNFPKGIKFDRFNLKGDIEAKMRADSAKYFEERYLWEFNGNVLVKNLKGEVFETQQLFWDDANRKFYSDKDIKITQKRKIIKGIGFESNASLTRYTIHKPTGIIPVETSN